LTDDSNLKKNLQAKQSVVKRSILCQICVWLYVCSWG